MGVVGIIASAIIAYAFSGVYYTTLGPSWAELRWGKSFKQDIEAREKAGDKSHQTQLPHVVTFASYIALAALYDGQIYPTLQVQSITIALSLAVFMTVIAQLSSLPHYAFDIIPFNNRIYVFAIDTVAVFAVQTIISVTAVALNKWK